MTTTEAKSLKVGDTVFYANRYGAVCHATVVSGHKFCNGTEVGIINVRKLPVLYFTTWDKAYALAKEFNYDASNNYVL